MKVTIEQLEDIMRGENYNIECDEVNDTKIHTVVSDLLEASAIIREMRQTLLEISQEDIASVCEGVRQKARDAWKKTEEYI